MDLLFSSVSSSTTSRRQRAAPPSIRSSLLYEDIDDLETSKLIAQLILRDLSEITESHIDVRTPPMDEEVVLDLEREYWEDVARMLQDRVMAESLDRAVETDRPCLAMLAAVERAAEDDRRAALALSQGIELPPLSPAQRMLEDRNLFAPPERENASVAQSILLQDQSPSQNRNQPTCIDHPAPSKKRGDALFQCTSCGDYMRGSNKVRGVCGHDYCPGCISDLIEACIRDESLYPPRCCAQPFTYNDYVSYLSVSLRASFDTKRIEFDVPAVNRLYCPRQTCSAFLGSSTRIRDNTRCTRCGTFACAQCKQISHPGEGCHDNAGMVTLRELARVQQWQTCPGCRAIVELHTGCFHIICRCRTEFCYVCAVPWKGCECPQWEESRLMETAHRRVEQEMVAPQPEPIFRARIEEMAATLRNNHDCIVHIWTSRSGPAQCEQCHDVMPVYIKVCRNCHLMVCRRCAYNRL